MNCFLSFQFLLLSPFSPSKNHNSIQLWFPSSQDIHSSFSYLFEPNSCLFSLYNQVTSTYFSLNWSFTFLLNPQSSRTHSFSPLLVFTHTHCAQLSLYSPDLSDPPFYITKWADVHKKTVISLLAKYILWNRSHINHYFYMHLYILKILSFSKKI